MIRLFVPDALAAGAPVIPDSDQCRYLIAVMRLAVGSEILLFNGRDGEWRATVVEADKRRARLVVGARSRAHAASPDLTLAVALVKRARLETIIEKAAELGAARVQLVITRRTNADHTNVARLQAIATEAAEQTGRLDVPTVLEPVKLAKWLDNWSDAAGRLMVCDETGGPPALDALAPHAGQAAPWSILIGPEGGFDLEELERLRSEPFVTAVSLGPRILRADTAAIAALSLWQAALGDWVTAS